MCGNFYGISIAQRTLSPSLWDLLSPWELYEISIAFLVRSLDWSLSGIPIAFAIRSFDLSAQLRDFYGIPIAFPIQSLDRSLSARLILFGRLFPRWGGRLGIQDGKQP